LPESFPLASVYWRAQPLFSFVAIAVAKVGQVVSLKQGAVAGDGRLTVLRCGGAPSLVVLALYMPTLELMWRAYSLE
jgi:hypothetical protein